MSDVEELNRIHMELFESFTVTEGDIEFIASIQYDGFDANKLFGLLKQKEPNDDVFREEMRFLCLSLLLRGPKIRKNLNRGVYPKKFIELINKYGVKTTDGGNIRGSTITLHRIVAVFPHFVCGPCAARGYGQQPFVEEVPAWMQNIYAPAIFPESIRDSLKAMWDVWHAKFKALHSLRDNQRDQGIYAAMTNSKFFSDATKQKIYDNLQDIEKRTKSVKAVTVSKQDTKVERAKDGLADVVGGNASKTERD